jgi:hypothetical protein
MVPAGMAHCLLLVLPGRQVLTSGENDYRPTRSSGISLPTATRVVDHRTDLDSFVPQQQAWLVERMGKFHRILQPGLAILVPIIDKIQYVKSLKEVAIEIPSQSAITADNVTLDLDVRPIPSSPQSPLPLTELPRVSSISVSSMPTKLPTASKMPNTPSRSWHRLPCAPRSASSLSITC